MVAWASVLVLVLEPVVVHRALVHCGPIAKSVVLDSGSARGFAYADDPGFRRPRQKEMRK